MRDNIKTPLAIFSVDLVGLTSEELTQRRKQIESELQKLDIQFNIAEGCYKGSTEQCYVISAGKFPAIETKVFEAFDQESVLLTDVVGAASLKFSDGSIVANGYFTEVQDINGLDAYTKFGSRKYACVGANAEALVA